jgi:DNA-binding MarR family transcriptional regulator
VTNDRVDTLLAQWKKERPDLDASPIAVLGRIFLVAQADSRRLEAALRPCGLTIPEFDVLSILRRLGAPFRQPVGVICEHTLISSGAMTNRIDRLEERGFVGRKSNPEDRRSVLVALTGKGKKAIDRAIPLRLSDGAEQLERLTAKERRALAHLLKRLLTGEDKAAP